MGNQDPIAPQMVCGGVVSKAALENSIAHSVLRHALGRGGFVRAVETVRYVGTCLFLMVLSACDSKESAVAPLDAGAERGNEAGAEPEQDARALGALCDPRAPACAADEKCTSTRLGTAMKWAAPRCTKDQGREGLGEGEACFSEPGAFDYCGSGLSCTSFGTGEGFCVRQCAEDDALCENGKLCAPVDATTGYKLCLLSCKVSAECDAPGFLECLTRGGVSYCDTAPSLLL